MWFSKHRFSLVLAAVFAAGLWATSASAGTMIDHFTSPPPPKETNPYGVKYERYSTDVPPSLTATMSGLTQVIGGTRTVSIDFVSGEGTVGVEINWQVAKSVASLYSNYTAFPRFAFEYDSGSWLNANLSGSDQFSLKFDSADKAGGLLTVTVKSGAGTQVATATKGIPQGGGMVNVAFANFAGINWTDVDYLKFQITGPDAYDAVIDYIETTTSIPLPATAWAGGALLCLLVVGKARRMARA